jgi:hypothetical protein
MTAYTGFGATGFSTSSTAKYSVSPGSSCTLKNLTVFTLTGTQPSSGALVITVRKDGAVTTPALSVTVNASQTASPSSPIIVTDSTDTISIGPTDYYDVIIANAASASSIAVNSIYASCS